MSVRKISFVEDEIYHICNRGVEKRNIFLCDKDYLRFIHNLYEFNDENAALNIFYRAPYEAKSRKIKKRKTIVAIHAFALMPNHYHLLLSQLHEQGITRFLHKIGTGYAMYFNEKNERSGRLFQGTFKAVQVEREAHMTHLPFYIHANPLDLKFPEWREQKMRDPAEAIKFLEEYRWSSFPDYIGKKNFPSVIDRGLLSDMFGHPEKFHAHTLSALKEMDLDKVRDVALEKI